MSVGIPVTKDIVDNQAGGIVLQLRNAFEAVVAFNNWLNLATTTDAYLESLRGSDGSVYGAPDVATLRNSYTFLADLYTVSQGGTPPTQPTNFWVVALGLVGTN